MEIGLAVVRVVVGGRVVPHGAQQFVGHHLVPHGNAGDRGAGGLRSQ